MRPPVNDNMPPIGGGVFYSFVRFDDGFGVIRTRIGGGHQAIALQPHPLCDVLTSGRRPLPAPKPTDPESA